MSSDLLSELTSVNTTVRPGLTIHSMVGGRGDPVVFLHGWPETWFEWRKILPTLARRYSVIAVDLPGMGDSSKPEAGYSAREVAEDLYRLLNALGHRRAHVVGHDMGVLSAYALAALHPEVVARLVLLESPLPGVQVSGRTDYPPTDWEIPFHAVPNIPEALVAGKERIYLTWFYRNLAYDKNAIEAAAIDAYVEAYSAPGALQSGFAYYRALGQSSAQIAELARRKLPMPVLAYGGEASFQDYPLRCAQAVAVHVSGGVIPRCGHFVAEERPDFLIAHLPTFFSRGRL